jgi:hypothetical protein
MNRKIEYKIKEQRKWWEIKGENVGSDLPPLGPTAFWALFSRPDRGRPTRYGWWAPVAQRYKRKVGAGARSTRFTAQPVPHRHPNPNPDLEKGRCQRREASPNPWRWRTTPTPALPPDRLLLLLLMVCVFRRFAFTLSRIHSGSCFRSYTFTVNQFWPLPTTNPYPI